MKISLKIFIFTYCMIMAVTMLGGFFLVQYEYEKNLNQAKKEAFEQNEMLFQYVAAIEEVLDRERAEISLRNFMEKLDGASAQQVWIDGYEALAERIEKGHGETLEDREWGYVYYTEQGRYILQVTSRCQERYIVNTVDIQTILERRDDNFMLYRNMILLISTVMAAVLYLFSDYITRPLVEEARRKEEFMGNFAHELKTPMTSIVGYADLLRTYDLSPDKRRVYSDFIYREGKRLELLSQHLLQLIVLDKQEYVFADVSTEMFFDHIEKECLFLEQKYQVCIQVQYDMARLSIEKELMLTAVLNLIDNACKASETGGKVLVCGKKAGEGYEISVQDNGIGMTQEELTRITEPFYMADKSRTRANGGAGLGLSLCKRITRLHKAELCIKSEAGEGTRASIIWRKGAGVCEA